MSAPALLQRRYDHLEKIGVGGMGEVWRGTDRMLEREIAIKVLRADLAARPDFVERFRIEAISMARLNHPNIVTVYEFVQDAGMSWMVLEFVRGKTLDQLQADRVRLPWNEAAQLIQQGLRGLAAAHVAGIVHRDVKPANAILTPGGTLKLMDFGIARISQGARLTRAGHAVGTVEYMSPEQAQGHVTDARADLYSVGVMFYELVAGRLPFVGNTDYEIIKQHIEVRHQPVSQLVPDVPRELDDLLARALAKSPERRFSEAGEFIAAIDRLLAEPGHPGAAAQRKRATPAASAAGIAKAPVDMPADALAGAASVGSRSKLPLTIGVISAGAGALALAAWLATMFGLPLQLPATVAAPEESSRPAIAPTAVVASPAAPASALASASVPAPAPTPVVSRPTPAVPPQVDELSLAIAECGQLVQRARAAMSAGRHAEAVQLARRAQELFSACDGSAGVIAEAGRALAVVRAPAPAVPRTSSTQAAATAAGGETGMPQVSNARASCKSLVSSGWQAFKASDFAKAKRLGEQALAADPSCPDAQTLVTSAAIGG